MNRHYTLEEIKEKADSYRLIMIIQKPNLKEEIKRLDFKQASIGTSVFIPSQKVSQELHQFLLESYKSLLQPDFLPH